MGIAQLLFSKGNFIDTIELDVIITEGATSSAQVTSNPIQSAVDSNDHIVLQPMTFSMAGAVSNASSSTIGQFSQNAFTPRKDVGVWKELLNLQASKKLFTLVQGLRSYPNVQITSLSESQDKDTYSSLFFTASLQQIIVPGGGNTADKYKDQNTKDQASPQFAGGIKQVITDAISVIT